MLKFVAAASTALLMANASAAFAETDPAAIAEAKEFVAAASKTTGEWPGPTASPPIAKDKSIVIISCHQASNCAMDSAGALEAAEAVGWKGSIVDGKGDVALYNASIRTAVNSGISGIIAIGLPPALIQDGMRYAHDAGVPIINGTEIAGPEDTFAASVDRELAGQGEQLAKWMIADSNGTAKAVLIRADEFPAVKLRQDTVAQVFETCADCKILDSVNLTVSQGANPSYMQQFVQSIVSRFGDELEYIVVPYGTLDGLIVPALRAAGRDDVKIVSYDGNGQQVQLCRDGQVSAVAATMMTWSGWANVDQLNRVFNGEAPAEQKIPGFLATKENCNKDGLAEQAYDLDFRSHYRSIWGLK
jgi:ribose transport system substrate-binding protein